MKCVKFRNICTATWGIIQSQYSWIRIVSGPLCDFFCVSVDRKWKQQNYGWKRTNSTTTIQVCVSSSSFFMPFPSFKFKYLKLNYYPCGPSEQQQIQKWKIEKSASCNVKPKEKWTTRNFENRNGTVGAFVTFSFNNWNWFELWPQ